MISGLAEEWHKSDWLHAQVKAPRDSDFHALQIATPGRLGPNFDGARTTVLDECWPAWGAYKDQPPLPRTLEPQGAFVEEFYLPPGFLYRKVHGAECKGS